MNWIQRIIDSIFGISKQLKVEEKERDSEPKSPNALAHEEEIYQLYRQYYKKKLRTFLKNNIFTRDNAESNLNAVKNQDLIYLCMPAARAMAVRYADSYNKYDGSISNCIKTIQLLTLRQESAKNPFREGIILQMISEFFKKVEYSKHKEAIRLAREAEQEKNKG